MSYVGTAIRKYHHAFKCISGRKSLGAVGIFTVTILAISFTVSLSRLMAAEAAPVANPAAAQAPQTAQQPPAVQSPAPASSANPSANAAQNTFHPRLPMHYAKVVDDKQRQKIYDIQRKYHPQIEALQKQLEELVAKRNAEIEAVLTPQQKAEIEKLRQEATTRRSDKAGAATGATSQSNENTSN